MRLKCCIGDPSLPEAYDTAVRRSSIVYWKMVELKSKFPNLDEVK